VGTLYLQSLSLADVALLPSRNPQSESHFESRRSVTHRREDNNRVRFLSVEEEKKLRKVIETKWASHLPELDLAINTGLRKGSQYGLTWDMVDWKGRMLNIPRTKNEEPIHVPLNDAAVAALRVVPDRGDARGRVFQSVKTGEPLENGRHWFDDAVLQAGIKNFRWHDLRHTFASRLRMKGAPLEDIADLLGHKSLTMTRRYAHLGPKNCMRWYPCWEQLPPQQPPAKVAPRRVFRKLLCSNHFRGVAQW